MTITESNSLFRFSLLSKMESLGYYFEEGELPFSEGVESNMDGFNNIRNLLKGCDAETFWSPKSIFDSQGFIEPHFPEMKENSLLHAQLLKNSLSDASCDSVGSLLSNSTITMNSSAEFGKSSSGLATGTNDEVLIADLKVEKLESPREPKSSSVSVDDSAKRPRMVNLQSQNPVCIVHGCNKDLSSSKEYHKRHKVCDVHSKTAVVIVNGVRQRFCQQCSRFHLLAEFDNGKRSCRRRLAGHNERRRKPQLENHFDSTFYGRDAYKTSLFFSTHVHRNEPIRHRSLNTELLKFDSSTPPPLLQHNPWKYCPSSPLSVLESNSSCAPSLLSAQSQSSFSHTTTGYPLSFNPNITGETEARNALGANTVGLLELSLHLQRVEHEKQYEQVMIQEKSICSENEHLMH